MTGETLTPCTGRPAAGGTGDAYAVHGADAHPVHAWDAMRARQAERSRAEHARRTGSDPLSAPRSAAGPVPGPITPGTVPGPALAAVAPRADCQHAGGCPHRVPCVGPCHASTVAGRAPGPTDRKRDPAPTTTDRRQDGPRPVDPSADAWTAAVAAPAWLAELLRADAARPVPGPAVPPPAFRRPELPGACLAGPAGHRADACPDVAEHVRAELAARYRAEARLALIGAPGAPSAPLSGILPGPAAADFARAPDLHVPANPLVTGTPAARAFDTAPDAPLTSTDAPPVPDSRPIRTGPRTGCPRCPFRTGCTGDACPAAGQAEHQAARVRGALAELADGPAPDGPPVAALSGPPPGWTTHTGPGALAATYRPPSPTQRARMAADAWRADAARARAALDDLADLADPCPVRPWAACVPPDGADPAACRAQCARLADVLADRARALADGPDRAPCPRHGYPHALPCPHDPAGGAPVDHDDDPATCRACQAPEAPPAPSSWPSSWATGAGRVDLRDVDPLSGPRTGPTGAPGPVTPDRPEEAPPGQEAPQDGPARAADARPLPGEPLPCSVGPGCPVCADRRARYGAPAGPSDEAPQDRPQDRPPAGPRVTVAASRLYPAPLGTAAPYEAPEPCAMAPYAPPGPDDAVPGNPWTDLGILDSRPGVTFDLPAPDLTGEALTWPVGTGAALTFTLSDATRAAFRALGIDLDREAAERARQDEARAYRRGHMRDLRARARYRAAGRPLPATLDPQGA